MGIIEALFSLFNPFRGKNVVFFVLNSGNLTLQLVLSNCLLPILISENTSFTLPHTNRLYIDLMVTFHLSSRIKTKCS